MIELLALPVRWVSHHTGIPAIVVAAAILVISWRLFRRWLRFFVELAFAVALLIVLTELGWIAW